jgi:hypothetical protein
VPCLVCLDEMLVEIAKRLHQCFLLLLRCEVLFAPLSMRVGFNQSCTFQMRFRILSSVLQPMHVHKRIFAHRL